MNALKYPLTSEKSVRMIESENKLTFIVEDKANRTEIKKEVESAFKVKVKKVNLLKGPQGYKKAIVTLAESSNALDVATDLGIM